MRRGRREDRSDQNDREAFALLVFCIEFRVFGQALSWRMAAPMIDLAARS
jgi:hypothetical protein